MHCRGLFFIAVVCFGASLVGSNPVPPSSLPWYTPCQQGTSASDVTVAFSTPSPVSVNETLASLVTLISETVSEARILKEQIHRLDSSMTLADFLNRSNSTLLSSDVMTWSNTEQTGEILKTYYRHLSLLYAYLEVTQSNSEGDNNVLVPVKRIQGKTLDVLCRYSEVLHSLGLNIANYVTRNDVSQAVRSPPNLSQANIYDYIIARDVVLLLDAIRKNHISVQRT